MNTCRDRGGRRSRRGLKVAGAVASVAVVLSMSGVLVGGAYASIDAEASTGQAATVYSAQWECDFRQEDTPAPIGDHRYVINNTCDQGLRHWVIIGDDYCFRGQQYRVYPASKSDDWCDWYINYRTPGKVPSISASCVNVDADLSLAINRWGNYFG